MEKVEIYYDGQCFFCQRFADMIQLKNKYDVQLIDLRKAPQKIAQFRDFGLDPNEGMIVVFEEKLYYGPEAVSLLGRLSGDSSFMKIVKIVSRGKLLNKPSYEILKFFRKGLLRIQKKNKL